MKEINFATSLESLDDRYVLNEDWFVMPPIEDFYDPTGGLPVDPEVGDRYISDATANGWTYDYVYEWDGTEWVESVPEEGWMIWELIGLILWVFFSGGWMEVGDASFLRLDGTNDPMTGGLTLAAGTATAGTAPLKFQAGTALTTPEAGALEYAGGKLYITNVAHQRALDRTSDVLLETITVADTTTKTLLWTAPMAANSLSAGNIFKFEGVGEGSNTANGILTISVEVNDSEVATISNSARNFTNDDIHIKAIATQRTIGAAGSRAFHLHLEIGADISIAEGVAAINTTNNMDVKIYATWSAASASNTFSLYQAFMEYKN